MALAHTTDSKTAVFDLAHNIAHVADKIAAGYAHHASDWKLCTIVAILLVTVVLTITDLVSQRVFAQGIHGLRHINPGGSLAAGATAIAIIDPAIFLCKWTERSHWTWWFDALRAWNNADNYWWWTIFVPLWCLLVMLTIHSFERPAMVARLGGPIGNAAMKLATSALGFVLLTWVVFYVQNAQGNL